MNPDYLFVDTEALIKELETAQENIQQLKARINDVPIEKKIKFLLIGGTIGICSYLIYQHFKEKKKNN